MGYLQEVMTKGGHTLLLICAFFSRRGSRQNRSLRLSNAGNRRESVEPKPLSRCWYRAFMLTCHIGCESAPEVASE